VLKNVLYGLLTFSCCLCFSQNIFIKRDNKLVELSTLKNLKIHQYQVSSGKDSVYRITEVDSLYKSGDTLVVRPWAVEEVQYLDPDADISIQKLYKTGSTSFLKIPISEIDKLVGKKRSLSKVFGILSTVAFIGVATSMPLQLSNSDNQAIGRTLFIVAAPTLILSWTLQATLAKKRYYFDKNRTDKKLWIFN
jgi:hypothetical protein